LVEARGKAGLTQGELAARLDRTQSFVSKYERGERRLDVVEFLEIARAIGLDPFQVIRDLNRPAPSMAKPRRR
jgi:transcriptional regulator with XRE-family HTH domain